MNPFQKTLAKRLQPQVEALTQSRISLVLIECSGKLDRNEALRVCPGVSSNETLNGGVYGPSSSSPADCLWREYKHDCDDKHVLQKYQSLAEQAGNCIKEWVECFGVAHNTITQRHGKFKWVFRLFDLAWSDNPWFHMEARKRYIKSARIDELQMMLRYGPLEGSKAVKAKAEIEQLRGLGFYSTLPDVAEASVNAINALTQPGTVADDSILAVRNAGLPTGSNQVHEVPASGGTEDLPPFQRKAYFSFLYAETKEGKKLKDQEAWDYLHDNESLEDAAGLGGLTDYKLPVFSTWSRYLREARNALGEQKNTRRAN